MAPLQCTKFHPFSQLPPELRRMIWDFVVEEPHFVEEPHDETWGEPQGFYQHGIEDKGTKTRRLGIFPKFPPVHDVCQEARKAFLESPGLVSEDSGIGVAWHPERDTLICRKLSWSYQCVSSQPDRGCRHSPFTVHGRRDVRNMRLGLTSLYETYPPDLFRTSWDPEGGVHRYRTLVEFSIRQRFPNIRTVELVADPILQSPGKPPMPEISLRLSSTPNVSEAYAALFWIKHKWDQGYTLKIEGKMVLLLG
ncbi:hypothetical protein PGQ11_009038 [Apiospora arundinis]|uniref:2EXR domain-containing protein n=1 Tax=Apiospora arundinis TaxID=335852 RepID=A0ABR2IGU9_9PEZI